MDENNLLLKLLGYVIFSLPVLFFLGLLVASIQDFIARLKGKPTGGGGLGFWGFWSAHRDD